MKIGVTEKIAFGSAIIGGIVSQGQCLFNKFAYSDALNLMFEVGATIPSGRGGLWILKNIEKLVWGNGHYSLPLYNGMIAILAIALSVSMIVHMLEIRDYILCTLLGIVFGAFPSLTALMYFDCTVHLYMVGMCIGIFGVFLSMYQSGLIKRIAGIVCIGISIGTYQAFLPIIVSLLLLGIMKRLYRNDENTGDIDILKQMIASIGVLGGGLAIYYLLNTILQKIVEADYSGYMGIGSEFEVSLKTYLLRIAVGIREFILPSAEGRESVLYTGNGCYVQMMLVLCWGVLSIVLLMMKWKQYSALKRIVLLCCYALTPIAVNLIYVMSAYRIPRMEYSMVMFYVFLAIAIDTLWENSRLEQAKQIKVGKILIIGLFAIASLGFVRTDNISYLKTTLVQEEAIHYFTVLVATIRNTEGYCDEYPVAYINATGKADACLKEYLEFAGIPDDPERNLINYLNDGMWTEFMAAWCGFDPETVSEQAYAENSTVLDMPSYPDQGSIRVIDGVVIVKF